MKGDFSRPAFEPADNISRVLLQQGRPLVEADLNEALMSLVNNQRKIIRRMRKDANEHHGAFESGSGGKAFTLSVVDDHLVVGEGDYRFEDLLFTNPGNRTAKSFRNVGDDWIADFSGNASNEDQPPDGTYIVGLAAVERELLLAEVETRAPAVSELRSGLPWAIDWLVFLRASGTIAETKYPTERPIDLQVGHDRGMDPELENRLWRIEIHSIEDDNIVLKVAIDNASLILQADSKSGQIRLRPFAGRLPYKGEWVEAESDFNWFGKPRTLHPVTAVAEYRDGIYTTAALPEMTRQVRVWQAMKKASVADLIAKKGFEVDVPFGQQGQMQAFNLRLDIELDGDSPTSAEVTAAKAMVQRGDGWTIRSDQAFSTDTVKNPISVSGTRQPVYHAELGSLNIAGGVVAAASTNGDDAILTISPANRLDQARASHVHKSHAEDSDPTLIAESVLCQRLFPELNCLAAKQWLASATLGEICGLTKDQLRERIQCDCESLNFESSDLESDLDLLITKRHHLLSTVA